MKKQLFIITILGLFLICRSYGQINPYQFNEVLESIDTVEDIPPFMSIEDLWLLRNYIFAKEKYKFKNTGLAEFFELRYDVVGLYDDVSNRFSDRELSIINELKRREQILREEKTWDVILDHTVRVAEGKLIVDGNKEFPINDKRARYISTRQLAPTLYSIQIESDYRIDTTGCCDEIGVTNDIIKQFFFDALTNTVTEVPGYITVGKTIDQIINQQYILVLNDIFSGAHDLEIYDFSTFTLIANLTQIEGIDFIDAEYLEIWRFTDKPVEYPYKYRRKYEFSAGTLKDTGIEEKINAEWYFAG